jgi:hypothetical protein
MPSRHHRTCESRTRLAVAATSIAAMLASAGLAHAQLAAPASKPAAPKKPAESAPAPAKAPSASPSAPSATPPNAGKPARDGGAPAAAPNDGASGRVGTPIDEVGTREEIAPESDLKLRTHFTKTRAADSPPLSNMTDRGLEQLGRLLYSKVDLEVEDQPLGKVLRELRRALGLNMVAFTASNGLDGIDPDRMVSVQLFDVSGREALEALASLAGPSVTWQIHAAVVEFGPKRVLARPEARFTRVYDAGDLALQAPDYMSCSPGGKSYNRRDGDEVLAELVRNISTHCEPEAFRAPPPAMVETPDGKLVPVQHTAPTPSSRSNHGSSQNKTARKNPNTTATFNFDPSEAAVFITGQWASIQTQDLALTVIAPDFVHRAIDGYEQAIPPLADEPSLRRDATPARARD